MKRIVTFAAAALLAATCALAQSNVNPRRENQQDRIAQGVGSGSLTAGETSNLETKEAAINQEVRADKSLNNGKLTTQEKQTVNGQQNNLSKQIYSDKHNAATGKRRVRHQPRSGRRPRRERRQTHRRPKDSGQQTAERDERQDLSRETLSPIGESRAPMLAAGSFVPISPTRAGPPGSAADRPRGFSSALRRCRTLSAGKSPRPSRYRTAHTRRADLHRAAGQPNPD